MPDLLVLAMCVLLIGAVVWSLNRGPPSYGEPPSVAPVQSPEVDLTFAAKGYMQVAVTRRHAPHIDLHHLEQAHAAELLKAGCTREQALAARWGGAYAIVDDLSSFDDAIAAYKETAPEMGIPYNRTKADAARMYEAAALLVMATVHTADPQEYGRFLRYIGS